MLRRFTVRWRAVLGFQAVLAATLVAAPVHAAPLSLFDFVVFSGGGSSPNSTSNVETHIGQNVIVYGHVGSNEDVGVISGAQIFGSIYAGRNFDGGQNITVGSNVAPQVIIANGYAEMNGDLYGDFHSGSGLAPGATTSMLLRSSADIFGNVYTRNNLQFNVGSGISVGGNATVGGSVVNLNSNTVSGSISTGSTAGLLAFTPIAMPAATSFTASTLAIDDRSCTGGGCSSLVLAPGTYRNLNVGQNKTLTLSSGNYYLNQIDTSSGLELYLDLSSGVPLNIYVVDKAEFGMNMKIFVKRPGDGGFTQISSLGDQSIASLVYLETKDRFKVHAGSEWIGTVYASLLELDGVAEGGIGQNIMVWGALYAYDSVEVLAGTTVNFVRSYLASPQQVPEPASLALLGCTLASLALSRWRRRR
jgi:hypothetical protein